MKKIFAFLLLFTCSILAAENVLPASASGKFGIWSDYIAARKLSQYVTFTAEGGFQKSDAIKVDLTKCGRVSVEHLRLYPGRKYRFGAFVRTKNLTARVCRFIIHNNGWIGDIRSATLPKNTHGQWQKVSSVGTVTTSNNGEYSFSLYANKVAPDAELEISAPFIEPVAEENEIFSVPKNLLDQLPSDGEYGLWTAWVNARKVPAKYSKDGGADNAPYLKADLTKHRIAIGGLKLEAKKIYRFGAFVRTSNIKKGSAVLLIHNHNWKRDVRSLPIPANTNGKWVRVEFSTAVPESTNGTYAFNLFGNKLNSDANIEISAPYAESMELKKKDSSGR